MQMDTKIILENVCKDYGSKRALNQINLTIEKGMFGLLGSNGAGKTTMMKVLTTLLQKTSGKITMCGIPIEKSKQIRSMVGYLPQEFSMYGTMSVYEGMDYLAVLSGVSKNQRKERIMELLQKVNLEDCTKKKIKTLSGGMKRRMGIAQALLHNPRVLIVDEPTAGLDPEERVRFRNLLCEVAQDRIVLLSTHIVGDIEATCEKIAVLQEGNLLYDGTVTQLLKEAEGAIFQTEISRMELEKVKSHYFVTGMVSQGQKVQIRFIDEEKQQFPFLNAEKCMPNVEDAYLYLIHKKEMR